MRIVLALAALCSAALIAQDFPYVVQRFAGDPGIRDGGPATSALLYSPLDVELDALGNLYVLELVGKRIRKVTPAGIITTVAELKFALSPFSCMARGSDGSFYVTRQGQIWKVSPDGRTQVSIVGNGGGAFQTSADGTLAVEAIIASSVYGVALDPNGLVTYTERGLVRRISAAGRLETLAGGQTGFRDGPAATAQFESPNSLAFDVAGNLYISDGVKVRKLAGGMVSTVAGTNRSRRTNEVPQSGPALATDLYEPGDLVVDPDGVVYFNDGLFIWKLANGTLTPMAGTWTRSYSDGPALSTYIWPSKGLSRDASGALILPEESTGRVRKLASGNVTTVAGRLHYFGDGGPAASSLLYRPYDLALGPQGSVFIADSYNHRVRKVSADGTISTVAGNGFPRGVSQVPGVQPATELILDVPRYVAADAQGNLFLSHFDTSQSGYRILQVSPAGVASVFAGTGMRSDIGDGGPAVTATFSTIADLTTDSSGNIYASGTSRIRKISTAGLVTNFAGTGTSGSAGDGGPATLAQLTSPTLMTFDNQGNAYVEESFGKLRRITTDGTIRTYNVEGLGGDLQVLDVRFDPQGIRYMSVWKRSTDQYFVYVVSPSGVARVIAGGGLMPMANGIAAANGALNYSIGFLVDAAGEVYLSDIDNDVVWKLVKNTPSGISLTGGNFQTGPAGTDLAAPIKVQLAGRAGVPPEGVSVNFAVTSGNATLSPATTTTDSTGTAFIRVRPTAPGPITVKATVPGTTLDGVTFSLSATADTGTCALVLPTISDVHSLSEWGNFAHFASGSYLEIKGSNLAQSARPWGGEDFQGSNAPIMMDGVSVAINGNAAFTYYISPGQLNVQAPADAAVGNVRITVSNCGGTSAPYTMQKAAIAPGLLAPGSFLVGGRQYLVALFPGGQTFVGRPNLIPGAAFREAKPGDSVTAYGIGFGDTTPATAPGVITAAQNSIPGLTISVGSVPAFVSYKGLAPGTVGLYQFDFTVPEVPDGDHEIIVKVGSTQLAQTLFLTVRR